MRPYDKYRNHLRVDFRFTCVYCRATEALNGSEANFQIDHFLPKCQREDLLCEYTNLFYCCSECNRKKSNKVLPIDPTEEAYGEHLEVIGDGTIRPLTEDGDVVIQVLGLGMAKRVEYRQGWLKTWSDLRGSTEEGGQNAFRRCFIDPPVDPDLLLLGEVS